MLNKLLERLIRLCRILMTENFKQHHKYQNKNQITNSNLILSLLKKKNYIPENIVDVGCGSGEWTLKMMKHFTKSKYFLFDANCNNEKYLKKLANKNKNLTYEICLLSKDIKDYNFYNMGTGSSIFEEQTLHPRKIEKLKSSTLDIQLPDNIYNFNNNLIKLDVQGSEINVLEGLKKKINFFELIILEVSLHEYNKGSPLFLEVINYMDKNNYKLYDMFDSKRLGEEYSYLLQFDCVFVRKDSNLLNVKF